MSSAKVALVSGANQGIGLETARQLAALGYEVFVGARKAQEGQAAAASIGAKAHYVHLDLGDPASFRGAAALVEEKFGHLDALVNNAGIGPDAGMKPSEAPIDLIRQTFETNVLGLVELTQTMLPLVRKSEAGRIVNVSSVLGSLSLNCDFAAELGSWRSFGYNGSKAAVNMFTVTLAFELKDTAIKVNSAHPGWVKTQLGGEEAPLGVEEGAKTSVQLATLPPDGPTGGYFHDGNGLAW
ncbi:MAG: SDR family oxidoreductase [Acidobacteria bacterium]|nr:SDR family oxidoreductase [Acidobacteriota bacterium]